MERSFERSHFPLLLTFSAPRKSKEQVKQETALSELPVAMAMILAIRLTQMSQICRLRLAGPRSFQVTSFTVCWIVWSASNEESDGKSVDGVNFDDDRKMIVVLLGAT